MDYYYYIQENKKRIWRSDPVSGAGCSDLTLAGTTTDRNLYVKIVNGIYLSRIETAKMRVSFLPNANERLDIGGHGKSLDQIVVNDLSNNKLYSFQMGYGYFMSDNNCTSLVCRRLKLTEVFKVSNDAAHIRLYSLEYDPLNLPPRDSHAIDHWGYYNANTANTKVPAVIDAGSCSASHSGANREADSIRSRANILTRVNYGSGGYVAYTYSGHVYKDESGVNQVAGGARIRIVQKCSGYGDCVSTYYSYNEENSTLSSGGAGKKPQYHFRIGQTQIFFPNGIPVAVSEEYLIRTSSSLTDLFDINGYHIGYSRVVERSPNQGYTISKFTGMSDHPDILPTQTRYYFSGSIVNTEATLNENYFPYTPRTSRSAERGLLLEKQVFSESNKVLEVQGFDYDFTLSAVKEIHALKVGMGGYCNLCNFVGASRYTVGTYSIISRPYVLLKSTHTIYDQQDPGNESKKTTTITDYSYTAPGASAMAMDLLPRTITETLPDGDKVVTQNKYPADYPPLVSPVIDIPARGILGLKFRNIDNALIESITYLDTKDDAGNAKKYLLNGSLNLFKEYVAESYNAYPWKIYKHKTGNGTDFSTYAWSSLTGGNVFTFPTDDFKLVNEFTGYDMSTGNAAPAITGQVTSYTGSEGIPTDVTWLLNDAYVGTITKNAGAAQHQFSYQHQMGVGLTRQTDPNGINTSYEYNGFKDLKLKKDHDGNFTHRYRSRVKGEENSMTFSYSGSTTVNSPITFTLGSGDAGYGATTFSWNFGVGAPVTNTSATMTYTYTAPGTYPVSVTRLSPEYVQSTIGAYVTIQSALAVSICANGATGGDLCRTGLYPDTFGDCSDPVNRIFTSRAVLSASVSGGCPGGVTYAWEYYYPEANVWLGLPGNSSTLISPYCYSCPDRIGVVRCRIIDSCGNSVNSNEILFNFFESSTRCQGQ